ncbi:hypothetical protein BDV96DRAFT_644102 [Lophiotrema nucula]|uniref:Uncharacterized protein n=1 Tax=Lophiotrema nucula TaxID=690887 RepID=A0A6A5ZE77_9PLEO|nr:hypothetical protein BDV96DRAFT_644102 [Lophiotrema nucula]
MRAPSGLWNGIFRVQPYDAASRREERADFTEPRGFRSPAELFQIPPHKTQSALNLTEMVATALDACQLNTSRRILAEIQLRINGFNVYG